MLHKIWKMLLFYSQNIQIVNSVDDFRDLTSNYEMIPVEEEIA